MTTENESIVSVTFCNTGAGSFVTIKTDRVEASARLPNGMRTPARDLDELADAEQLKAEAATRRAERLRKAAEHLRAKEASSCKS